MSNNQTIKNLRVKNNETSISQVLPIGADAVNVELANRRNLQETIGNIDSRVNGSITNNLEVLSSAIQTLDNIKADTAMIGSPLVAGTASEMTDTSHIYVYTGNESGYTNGNWYYYDGTIWASGGVYNSTAVETDKTLKVENVAADSRAAGNMVLVSQTQPAAASNKIWIDPDAREIEVPTMDDFDTLAGSVADLYDQTSTYAVGDYCMYEGQLYKCSTAINTAQDWTAAHWTAQVLTDNIQTDLSSKVNSPGSNGTSGQVLTTNGNGTTSWTTPLAVDNTLSQTGKAADAKKTGDEIAELKDDLSAICGELLYDGSHAYSGGAENWRIMNLTPLTAESYKLAIKLYTNTTGVPIEIAIKESTFTIVAIITDDNWHIIDVPSGVTDYLYFTYRGDSPVNMAGVVLKVSTKNLENDIANIENDIVNIKNRTEDPLWAVQTYGNQGTPATVFQSSFLNFTACPCKKADKAGKITSIYVKSYSSGTTKLYVGEVDQLHLFVPRMSYDIDVDSGEQNIDVSNLDIFIGEGEQVLYKFIGQTPFKKGESGDPEADASFYYSPRGTLQLEVYASQNIINFGFGYTVKSSTNIIQDEKISKNAYDIASMQENITFVQSNLNVVSDRQGNKYKMIVQNNAIVLLPMNFRHVLCVGNSYTIHPTTTDAETDYRNNLWWGHWAMAASSDDTAWTELLQTALKQKNPDAVVTPVFGRRYETSYTTYPVNANNTFTYWDGTEWQSLRNNVTNFSDVDAVVFFLGANYSGNDWYTLYKAMIEQFYTWFPTATMFCCSCSYSAIEAKDNAIQAVASEEYATYISMVGTGSRSKIGSYVKGDDNNLHQIANSAVANHYGDYGEYLINDRICTAMGYANNTDLYDVIVSQSPGVVLSVVSNKTIENAVISVFAEVESGTTLTDITVTDANNNSIQVTDHGVTDYGRIFTFIMPSSNVTITANVS